MRAVRKTAIPVLTTLPPIKEENFLINGSPYRRVNMVYFIVANIV